MDDIPGLRIWIDATQPGCEIRAFGMMLIERLLRAVADTAASPKEVCVQLPSGSSLPEGLAAELLDCLPLRWRHAEEPLGRGIERALQEAQGDPLLVLSGDTVVDTRVIQHLCAVSGSFAFVNGEGAERGAALRLEGDLPGLAAAGPDLVAVAEHAIDSGAARDFSDSDFDPYLTMLRRVLPPYLFRVADAASRDRVERFLFWSNYKGSTDFLTKYVYPPFVWAMVRPLARWRVHPNWVTALDYVATFAAVPFFLVGNWVPGMALAYLMSVLDSVDGKLARLTYTSSRFGEILDHGLDIVHPPIWYLAWGYSLGGGDLSSPTFRASLWMFGFYVADRIVTGIFKGRTGRSIHGFTPLDEKVRTFISRRNVNLALFTVALLLDWALPGLRAAELTFYFIVLWQAACLVWHAQRVVQFWNARPAA
jgi:phosphatidylglycerophosphate synthase